MRFAADDVAERAVVDAADELDEGRTVANLESDIQAEFAFGALAGFDDAQRAGDVHRHRLFEIDVLAGGYDGFKMLRMKVRRRGDDDGVDFLRVRDLLVCVGAEKKLRRVNVRIVFDPLELIEMRMGHIKLIAEEVSQRDHARVAGIDQVCGVFRAASPTAQQTNAHCGVGRRAVNERRLDEHHACCGGGGSQKFASVNFV